MKKIVLLLFILSIITLTNSQNIRTNTSPCSVIVKGEVRDLETLNLLPKVTVRIIEIKSNVIRSKVLGKNAMFRFRVKCNKEYKLEILSKGYKEQSKIFNTSYKKNEELKLLIILDKINQ